MATNGALPPSELTSIGGVKLADKTAIAFANMRRVAKAESKISLSPYNRYSGYRSRATTQKMRTTKMPWLYGMTRATQRLLAVEGPHGTGRAIDLAGVSGARLSWLVKNAKRFGFSRPLPGTDPAHFVHDGHTSIVAPDAAKLQQKALNREVAKYLNDNDFTVRDSKTEKTGVRDITYWRGVQRSAGIMPTGTIGPRTLAEQTRLQKLVS